MKHTLSGTCLSKPYRIILNGNEQGFRLTKKQEFYVLSQIYGEAYQDDEKCWLSWEENNLRLHVA